MFIYEKCMCMCEFFFYYIVYDIYILFIYKNFPRRTNNKISMNVFICLFFFFFFLYGHKQHNKKTTYDLNVCVCV